jgi:hypothetical protein
MTADMTLEHSDNHFPTLKQFHARGWNRHMCGAAVGLFGGILVALIGSLFTAISWFIGPTWHGFALQRTGTILLVSMIPLLLLGAHCLDRSEKNKANG